MEADIINEYPEDKCLWCNKPISSDPSLYHENEYGECVHLSCKKDYDENENEKKYDRWQERLARDFYGGETNIPVNHTSDCGYWIGEGCRGCGA